jgi:hypothetical protein
MDFFEGDAFKDAAAQALLAKVRSTPYEGPFFDAAERLDAALKVTMKDGRVFESKVDRPLGRAAENAIPAEDLKAKFRDCATRLLTPETADSVCQRVWTLEGLHSVRDLTAMLESPDATRANASSERQRERALA